MTPVPLLHFNLCLPLSLYYGFLLTAQRPRGQWKEDGRKASDWFLRRSRYDLLGPLTKSSNWQGAFYQLIAGPFCSKRHYFSVSLFPTQLLHDVVALPTGPGEAIFCEILGLWPTQQLQAATSAPHPLALLLTHQRTTTFSWSCWAKSPFCIPWLLAASLPSRTSRRGASTFEEMSASASGDEGAKRLNKNSGEGSIGTVGTRQGGGRNFGASGKSFHLYISAEIR